MLASNLSEPDRSGTVIFVGRNRAGHWLVQDDGKRLEGRFVSYAAAMSYAHGERHFYHARVEVSATPLMSIVPHGPIGPDDLALRRAA